jgi:hypothetical protein
MMQRRLYDAADVSIMGCIARTSNWGQRLLLIFVQTPNQPGSCAVPSGELRLRPNSLPPRTAQLGFRSQHSHAGDQALALF